MELPVVALVGNVRFDRSIHPVGRPFVRLVLVWLMHGDVLNSQPDKRLLLAHRLAAYPRRALKHLDEVYNNVEGR